MSKKVLRNLAIALAIIAVLLFGGYVYYVKVYQYAQQLKEYTEYISELNTVANAEPVTDEGQREQFEAKLDTILNYIDYYYYQDADYDVLYDAMLHAAVDSLGDPYSVYYSAKEYADLLESSSGEYSGIGATISQDMTTMNMTVVTPFSNAPAYKAGVRSGDQIIAVNGESVIGELLTDVVLKIKGPEGTDVEVTFLRDGEELTFTITRARVEVEFVSHHMLDDEIGYILVSEFEETTAKQFNAAIDDLLSQGMKGLVVDIRSNPGGLYNIVCDMLDRILPKDSLLVYTEDKYGNKRYEYATTSDTLDIPIAVLVNGNSASASEIFSGALQDYGKATIVGTQTFGKGIVQSVIPIYSDYSGVKLTSSHYFTPNGVCIHGVGITPDVIVELDEDLLRINIEMREYDNQLDAAVDVVREQLK